MYDTFQEANQKLAGTIIGHAGKAFYVSECVPMDTEKVQIVGNYVGNKSLTLRFPITSSDWEFYNLGSRLGYANVEWRDYDQAVYATRTPIRRAQNTQGISPFNIRLTRLLPNRYLGLRGDQIPANTFIGLSSFLKMWDGEYPSMSKVRADLAKPGIMIRAFGRRLAIQKSDLGLFYLLYKGENIGFSDDLETFTVPKQFRYLDELLIEDHKLKVK